MSRIVPYSSVSIGEFAYDELAAPVVLNAGQTSWITFDAGGHNGFSGYNQDSYALAGLSTTGVATLLGCADQDGTPDTVGALVDFKYTPTAPSITSQPQSQSSSVGASNVSFTVAATGDAPLSYQWRKDGATSQAPPVRRS